MTDLVLLVSVSHNFIKLYLKTRTFEVGMFDLNTDYYFAKTTKEITIKGVIDNWCCESAEISQ